MQKVTVKQVGFGMYEPSMGGIGVCWRPNVTDIQLEDGALVKVVDTDVVIHWRDGGREDVTHSTPQGLRRSHHNHDAVVAYWTGRVQQWAKWNAELDAEIAEEAAPAASSPAPAEVIIMGVLEIEGKTVDAPGFTRERFLAAVERAKREQLRTAPGTGCVMVQSGSDDARYAVTRERCECMAGRTHGHCKHRALAIYLQDVQGVDIMRVPTIGFNERGVSVTIGRRPAANAEVA